MKSYLQKIGKKLQNPADTLSGFGQKLLFDGYHKRRDNFLKQFAKSDYCKFVDPHQKLDTKSAFWHLRYGSNGNELADRILNRNNPRFFCSFLMQENDSFAKAKNKLEMAEIKLQAEKIVAGDLTSLSPNCPIFKDQIRFTSFFDRLGKWPNTEIFQYPNINGADLPSDPRSLWEINRLQYLPILAYAYLLFDDDRFGLALKNHLELWIEQNLPGFGINWLQAQEVAIRANSLVWIFAMISNKKLFDNPFCLKLLQVIWLHGYYLEHNLSLAKHANNHLITEAASLANLGLLFPEFKHSTRWKNLGCYVLKKEVNRQINADGVHGELATGYHLFVMESIAQSIICYRVNHDDSLKSLEPLVISMLDFGMRIFKPNGDVWLIGDNDSSRAFPAVGKFLKNKMAVLKIAKRLRDSSDNIGTNIFSTKNKSDEKTIPLKIFRHSGFVSYKDKNTSLMFRCGVTAKPDSMLPNHQHADLLGITLSYKNQILLDDPGVFEYSSNDQRRFDERKTASHNAPCVDSADAFVVTEQRFGTGKTPTVKINQATFDSVLLYVAASHEGYFPAGNLSRELIMSPDKFIIIIDTFVATDEMSHTLAASFLSPAKQSETESETCWLISNKKYPIKLIPIHPADVRQTCHACSINIRYAKSIKANKQINAISGKGTLCLVHLITLDDDIDFENVKFINSHDSYLIELAGFKINVSGHSIRWRHE